MDFSFSVRQPSQEVSSTDFEAVLSNSVIAQIILSSTAMPKLWTMSSSTALHQPQP